MKICVVTDNSSGITPQEATKLGIFLITSPVIIDGVEFFENKNLSYDAFYTDLINKDVRTSQPAPGEVIELWNKLLLEYEAILHIPLSSGLSQTCATAKMLAEEDKYKGKVFVVDNKRVSVTLRRSIEDALYLIDQGYKPQYIQEVLEKEGKNSSIFIMVDTLQYLKKGGRVTPAGAALGSVLHVKPVLAIFGDKLDAYKKGIGTKGAKKILIQAIYESLETKFKDVPKEQLAFDMAYTYDLDTALAFKKEVMNEFKIKDKTQYLDQLSLLIATHIGPGSLAVTITKKIAKN